MKAKQIDVYLNIDSNDLLVGHLFVDVIKGKEIYSFSYDNSYLNIKNNFVIDPELSLIEGRQYKKDSSSIYGFISDTIPDRWGRNLLIRNEKRKALLEKRNPEKFGDSDFLLGVNDFTRQGALRYKLHTSYKFLGEGGKQSVPKLVYINKLEQLCFDIDALSDDDLKDLFNPGSSLGGARPKATVFDNNGALYIAKFSHKQDDYDVPKFEYFANLLAIECGLKVPECKLIKGNKSIFLEKRFDRDGSKRIPYVSAMTLLGASDGDNELYSYLDLIDLINAYSVNPNSDLIEMFRRLVFNCIIHNGDDHLRNHGFLFNGKGYELSPVFDINPDPNAIGLSLSFDGFEHMFSFANCLEISKFFGLNKEQAIIIIKKMVTTVSSKFDVIAKKAKISEAELKKFIYIKENNF
ncbi:MAG: type II toxin-antitoxin system HipA family toxin [Firmicutes bacterium]|nr:type II toxin-antitoxin system HipA family toxin [Candidatus Fiminaster equi]